MTDIVERLRWSFASIDYEAADEIERLRAERDRLLRELREVGTGDECRMLAVHPPRCARAARARAALEENRA